MATARISARQLAGLLEVSHTAVNKAIKTGRLSASVTRGRAGYLIDPALARREWQTNTDPAQRRPPEQRAGAPAGEWENPAQQQLYEAGAAPPQQPAQPRDGTYAAARAVRESIEARIKRIELDRLRGDSIPTAMVAAARFHTGRVVRDAIMRVPERISARLVAAAPDEAEVQRLLAQELEVALLELVEHRERNAGD